MNTRNKTVILLICLMAALMLSGCQTHVDSDPWPASDGMTVTDVADTGDAEEANDAAPEVQDATQTQSPEVSEPSGEPGLNG